MRLVKQQETGAKPASIPLLPGKGGEMGLSKINTVFYGRHESKQPCPSPLIDNSSVRKIAAVLKEAFELNGAKAPDFSPIERLQGALIALSGKKGETREDAARIGIIYKSLETLYSAFVENGADSYMAEAARKEAATAVCAVGAKKGKIEGFANSILEEKSSLRLSYNEALEEGAALALGAKTLADRAGELGVFSPSEVGNIRNAEQSLAMLRALAERLGAHAD